MTFLEPPLITKSSILNECKFPWINEVKEIVGFEPIFIGCSLVKGCGNNCSYCWVKYKYENKNFRNWGPKSGVFHKIEFCKNALDLIVKELPFLPSNAVIIASNMTDPFPDIFFESQRFFQVFKQWLQLLRNNWVLFITKNAKIIRYLDFFNPERHIIGLSITGRLSPKEKEKYEPNSSRHLTRIVTLTKAKKLGYKIFASIEPPLKPTPEIVQDLINYNLDSATMVCGLANYELENLWSEEDYIRFYDETLLLKEKYDLKLSWKIDALNQIKAWKAKEGFNK